MVTIAKFTTLDEAQLARMKLEGSGIDAFVADEAMVTMNWFYSNAIGGIRLQVREEDKSRAIEILAIDPVEQGMITCPNCGSSNVSFRRLSRYSLLSFFLIAFLPVPSRKVDCQDCKATFTCSNQ